MARVLESPWSLRLTAVGFLAIAFAPVPANAPTRPYTAAVVLVALLFFFVLRGSRIAWVIALLGMAAGVVGTALHGTAWEVAVRLLLLTMIVLPASLAFVWRPNAP